MILVLVYITFVIALYLAINPNQPLIFLLLLFIVNVIVIVALSHYLLRSLLFPYSNYFVRQKLDSAMNERFCEEFGKLLDTVQLCLEIMAGLKPIESYEKFKDRRNQRVDKQDGVPHLEVSDNEIPATQKSLYHSKKTIIEINHSK